MVTKIAIAESSTADKLRALIANLLPLYEQKIRRRKLEDLTRRLRRAVANHFKQRERVVLHNLQTAWRAKMEAIATSEWIAIHAFDYDEEMEALRLLLGGFYIEAGEWGVNHLLASVSAQVGKKVIYRGSMEWIRDNAIVFGQKYADLVTETTNQAIRDAIAESIGLGEGLDDVMARISDVYADAEGYRSEMIARTEMARAYNASALEQAKALGITQYDWVGCDPACPICGPYLQGGPYTAAEIAEIINGTHPNCAGGEVAIVPDDFVEPIP